VTIQETTAQLKVRPKLHNIQRQTGIQTKNLKDLTSENDTLKEENNALKSELSSVQDDKESRIRALERELEKLRRDVSVAQSENKKLQEQAFRSVSHGNEPFTNAKTAYGLDNKVLEPAKPRAPSPPPKVHEAPFKPSNPSKQGYNKTINKFPEYKADPIKVAVRQIEDPSSKKDPFKPNNTSFIQRPTPSISLNKANLKSEMSRMSAM